MFTYSVNKSTTCLVHGSDPDEDEEPFSELEGETQSSVRLVTLKMVAGLGAKEESGETCKLRDWGQLLR